MTRDELTKDGFAVHKGPNVGDLTAIKTTDTTHSRVELVVLSAESQYQQFVTKASTPLAVTEAPNFDFAMSGRDLVAIKKRNTESGKIEVHILRAADNYQTWGVHTRTAISIGEARSFSFAMAGQDLVAIKRHNTPGTVEVNVLSAASSYEQYVMNATPIALEEAPDYDFVTSGRDLVAIKTRNTKTPNVQVHMFSAAHNYQQCDFHVDTPLRLSEAPNFTFAMDQGSNLLAIKKANTPGFVEVHLIAADDYHAFVLQIPTPIPIADAPNFTFAVMSR